MRPRFRGWLLGLCLCGLAAGCVVTPLEGPGHAPRAATRERIEPTNALPADSPEEIAASHLLIQYAGAQSAGPSVTRSKAEARARADEALAKAKAGEPFANLVAEYSDEPGAAAREGRLGRFAHQAMVKPFADAAFSLKVGEISDVVESPFGYHVILRTE